MSDERKRRGWHWWATVAMLVLYPLSFGPACWLGANDWIHDGAFRVIYGPILWAFTDGPDQLSRAIEWYALQFGNVHIVRAVHGEPDPILLIW